MRFKTRPKHRKRPILLNEQVEPDLVEIWYGNIKKKSKTAKKCLLRIIPLFFFTFAHFWPTVRQLAAEAVKIADQQQNCQ